MRYGGTTLRRHYFILRYGGTTYLPLTTYHLPLTTYHLPLTTHHSPLTTHDSRLTTHDLRLTTYDLRLTTYDLPFTTYDSCSRLTTYDLPLTTDYLPVRLKAEGALTWHIAPLPAHKLNDSEVLQLSTATRGEEPQRPARRRRRHL